MKTLASLIFGLIILGVLIILMSYCAQYWFKPFVETPYICTNN